VPVVSEDTEGYLPASEIPQLVESLKKEMKRAAEELDFERAAELRDRIRNLQERDLLGARDDSWVRSRKERAGQRTAASRYHARRGSRR
jgi:hypothetical protein